MLKRKVIITLLLAAILTLPVGAAHAKEQLVVSTWGFAYDIFKKTIQEPFEKLYDVEIVYEFGNNAERIAKLKMFKNNPRVDVVHMTDYFAEQLIQEGIFEKLDYTKLKNFSELHDFAREPNGAGYGPAYTVSRFGIVYRSDMVKKPITSFHDLWRSDLAGHIALPELSTTQGPMFLAMIAKAEGVSLKDSDAVFKKLKTLKPAVVKFYNKSSELINMFERGEIWVAPAQQLVMDGLLKVVPSATWADPKEGSVAVINTLNVVAGSRKKDLALKYIDFVLSRKVQYDSAVLINDSPTNKLVKIPPAEVKTLTVGKAMINSLITLDWNFINSQRDKWLDRWNREIAGN